MPSFDPDPFQYLRRQALGPRSSGPTAQATLDSYIARMTVAPSATQTGYLRTLVNALDAAGSLAKMDAFHIEAAHTAQASGQNVVSPSYTLVPNGGITFTPFRGWQGNGTDGYLDSGFDPTTAPGAKFTQNNAHMGGHALDANASTNGYMGSRYARVRHNGAAATSVRANTPGNVATPAAPTPVHLGWSRTSATAVTAYANGAPNYTGADASIAPESNSFRICGTGGSVGIGYATNQVAISHWGSVLTDAEMLATRNAINAYLVSVGAI